MYFYMENIKVPRFVLENIEDTLRLANNLHKSYKKETCFDRNVIQSLNCVRKLLSGQEITGSERCEPLIEIE